MEIVSESSIKEVFNNYQNDILQFILQESSDENMKLFAQSFYMYLKYEEEDDFVIDLDNIWKWLGFTRKDPAKRLLVDKFEENIDFRVFHFKVENPKGGRPSEKILMKVDIFKEFCMLANTDKSKSVRKYYVFLEKCLQKFIRLNNEKQLKELQYQHQMDKKMEKHKLLLELLKNKKCVYLSEITENLIKI